MEILATVEYKGFYVSLLGILGFLSILFLGLIAAGIEDFIKNGIDLNGVGAMVICSIFASILIWGFVTTIKDGVPTEYKVKVTDFNEVYEC